MLKIAICDDDKNFVDFEKCLIEGIETDECKEVDCFFDEKIFFEILNKKHYDIVFLDVDMPQIDGFKIAEKLNSITTRTILIFVTSHEHVAIEGYKYNAFRFIRKNDFQKNISEVFYSSLNKLANDKLTIQLKYKSNLYKLELKNIIYLVSLNNYISIKYLDECLKFRLPLTEIKNQLLKSDFAIANRGILINCSHIDRIDQKKLNLYMDNDEFIKISKTGLANIKVKLMEIE